MDNSLEATEARLRRVYFDGETMEAVYPDADNEYDTEHMWESDVDRWVLSRMRADDGEPVTEEWCDSVMDRYQDDWGVPYWSPWSQVVFRLDGCVFICNEEFKPAITRGDVRQLCKALGVELKEQA